MLTKQKCAQNSATRRGRCGDRAAAEGFSLLEVMVAMVLMAIGLLAVAAAQLHSLRYSADSDNRSQAAYLAEEKLGEILAWSANDPRLGQAGLQTEGGNNAPIILANMADDINPVGVGEHTQYRRSWTIQPAPGLAGLQLVTVTVTWDSQQEQRAVQMTGVR